MNNYKHSNNQINWMCKICKDIPQYAEQYLQYREKNLSNQPLNEDDEYFDFLQLRYYYSLLYFWDQIHDSPQCCNIAKIDLSCPNPKNIQYYKKIYKLYSNIIMQKVEFTKTFWHCNICAILPEAIHSDLNYVARNLDNDQYKKTQKLELYEIIADGFWDNWNIKEICRNCKDYNNIINLCYFTQTLKKYLHDHDRTDLHVNLGKWCEAITNDYLYSRILDINKKIFQATPISIQKLEKCKLVYLDFNMYQLYENNKEFQIAIDLIISKKKVFFIYSPTHMEEICRMNNSEFEKIRKRTIEKICNNYEVLASGKYLEDFLNFFLEPVDVSFLRAKRMQTLNLYAENKECANFEYIDDLAYKLLKWDEKNKGKIRKLISNMSLTEICDPQNTVIDNNTINTILQKICNFSFEIQYLKNYCVEEKPFSELRAIIQAFYKLMYVLDFHKNKIQKSTKFTYEALYPLYHRDFYRLIRSGFYDIDHICYATKCDYFVTNDKTLALQSKNIYEYIGCKTKVVSKDELIQYFEYF